MALHSNLVNVEEKEPIMADADHNAELTAEQKRQMLIDEMKTMSNDEVLRKLNEHFEPFKAYLGEESISNAKLKMAQDIEQQRNADATYASQASKVLVWEEMGVAVSGDKKGMQNTTISGQKALGELAGTNFWGGASGTFDNKGDVTNTAAWLNEVFPDFKVGTVNVLPVAQQRLDYQPGSDFAAGNATFTQGYIGNPEGTKLNWYQLLSVKGDGSALNTTANVSYDFQGPGKQLHSIDGGVTQNLMGKGTDLTLGYIGHDPDAIAKGVGLKGELRGFLNNVQNSQPDPGFMAKLSVTFGEGAENAKPSELVTKVSAANENQLPATKNLDYDFRSLSLADQKTVMGFMVELTGKPEAEIRDQLAKVDFKVNAHNTESYLDDTPQQKMEQVATR